MAYDEREGEGEVEEKQGEGTDKREGRRERRREEEQGKATWNQRKELQTRERENPPQKKSKKVTKIWKTREYDKEGTEGNANKRRRLKGQNRVGDKKNENRGRKELEKEKQGE